MARSLARNKERYTERKAAGLCVDCATPSADMARCQQCRDRNLGAVRAYLERPGVSERARLRHKVYRQRPEVKAIDTARHNLRYRQPEIRQRIRAYHQRPEVKARDAERVRLRYRLLGGDRKYRRFRVELHAVQGGRCAICGIVLLAVGADSHVDHIIPVSKGGLSTRENLQLLCPPCNLSKNDRILPAQPTSRRQRARI